MPVVNDVPDLNGGMSALPHQAGSGQLGQHVAADHGLASSVALVCATARLPMLTICALHNLGRSAARSATSSPFRCIAFTIASCIGMVTRVAWWWNIKIDPRPVAHRLWQHARLNGSMARPSLKIATQPNLATATNEAGQHSASGEPRF